MSIVFIDLLFKYFNSSMHLIYSVALALALTGLGNNPKDVKPVEDSFEWAEVLPFDMLIEISSLKDDRPLIDRLTLDMIGEIPIDGETMLFTKQ